LDCLGRKVTLTYSSNGIELSLKTEAEKYFLSEDQKQLGLPTESKAD